MKRSSLLTGASAALGMFILIIDGQTALAGASQGLELCIRSVIPSLFPFLVLGIWLTGNLSENSRVLLPLGRLFRIPAGTESILLTSFLGGYPIGAQTVAAAWRSGSLSKSDAEKMLAFCNQAGPSFLFGILSSTFAGPYHCWLLWGIQIFSALLVSRCVPPCEGNCSPRQSLGTTLPECMETAIRAIAKVCGWVILFRVLLAFLIRWLFWALPDTLRVMLTGILELANGCLSLTEVGDEALRFQLCAGILSFGGICISMQTRSVTQGLQLHFYFPGKILQGCISMTLAWFLRPNSSFIPIICALAGVFAMINLRKTENKGRNPVAVGV